MSKILFATTNKEKLAIAQAICHTAKLDVEQVLIEVDEIQGEDPVAIVKDKAQRAYEAIGKPIVVSDDSWDIPALNGFPGPYMKSINHWFEAGDFIRLMQGVKDRTVILHQYLAYADGHETVVFSNDIKGKIIKKPRGTNDKSPNMTVIELDADNEKTIAEVFAQSQDSVIKRYLKNRDAWHGFVEWYKTNN
jgi:XTP/dITP diphosphohydrolase